MFVVVRVKEHFVVFKLKLLFKREGIIIEILKEE